ncbi:MAG: hypothetical protein ABIA04_14550 [Pseudomonadota bacterium]
MKHSILLKTQPLVLITIIILSTFFFNRGLAEEIDLEIDRFFDIYVNDRTAFNNIEQEINRKFHILSSTKTLNYSEETKNKILSLLFSGVCSLNQEELKALLISLYPMSQNKTSRKMLTDYLIGELLKNPKKMGNEKYHNLLALIQLSYIYEFLGPLHTLKTILSHSPEKDISFDAISTIGKMSIFKFAAQNHDFFSRIIIGLKKGLDSRHNYDTAAYYTGVAARQLAFPENLNLIIEISEFEFNRHPVMRSPDENLEIEHVKVILMDLLKNQFPLEALEIFSSFANGDFNDEIRQWATRRITGITIALMGFSSESSKILKEEIRLGEILSETVFILTNLALDEALENTAIEGLGNIFARYPIEVFDEQAERLLKVDNFLIVQIGISIKAWPIEHGFYEAELLEIKIKELINLISYQNPSKIEKELVRNKVIGELVKIAIAHPDQIGPIVMEFEHYVSYYGWHYANYQINFLENIVQESTSIDIKRQALTLMISGLKHELILKMNSNKIRFNGLINSLALLSDDLEIAAEMAKILFAKYEFNPQNVDVKLIIERLYKTMNPSARKIFQSIFDRHKESQSFEEKINADLLMESWTLSLEIARENHQKTRCLSLF